MKKNQRKKMSKPVVVALVLAVLIIAGVALYVYNNSKSSSNSTGSTAETTSTAESAQSDFSDGNKEKAEGSMQSEKKGSAQVQDTRGQQATNTSNPRVSNDKAITVYSPLDNVVLKSGQQITGASQLQAVNYRIIDNVSGVIATGTLKVLDGKFSGTISFSTTATEGRIDVFAAKTDGSEYATINIPVRF